MTRLFIPLSLVLALVLAPVAPAAPARSKSKTSASSSARKPALHSKPAPKSRSTVVDAFPAADTSAPPKIRAAAAIVIDAHTGQVLYEHNADQTRPVASTQKLLTALLVAEEGNLNRTVRVTASDTWAEPTKLYIKPGEEYRRADFLRILLVKSMNDVARALARDNAGSQEAFAAKMNARASQLGMHSSNFVNPNGLPATGQFSTARDMARLAQAAYRNRVIREYVQLKETTWRSASGKTTTYLNTNRVLRNYALCNGMKTGYTNASGFCLISSAGSPGREVIAVVLGNVKDAIWMDSYKLLAWGLAS